MAYDLETGRGADLPIGDRYYGPAEWAGQGGGREGEFERAYLRGANVLEGAPGPARSYTGVGPRGYRRSPELIAEEVHEALTRDPDLDAGDIEVAVRGDEVILTGSVRSRSDRWLAEDIVAVVRGVREVQNRLRVVPR